MPSLLRALSNHPIHKDFGLLLIRVGIGTITLVFHGYGKITGGPELWAGIGGAMGNLGIGGAPALWGFMAAFAEFACSILIILGHGHARLHHVRRDAPPCKHASRSPHGRLGGRSARHGNAGGLRRVDAGGAGSLCVPVDSVEQAIAGKSRDSTDRLRRRHASPEPAVETKSETRASPPSRPLPLRSREDRSSCVPSSRTHVAYTPRYLSLPGQP